GVEVDTVLAAFTASVTPATTFVPAKPTDPLPASDTDTWRAVSQAWKSNREVFRDPQSGDFSLTAAPGARKIRRPRVGVYKAYTPSMDEGWTRWILENVGFAFTSVYAKDIQAGDLNSRFDAIVFPEMSANNLQSGHAPGTMPDEYVGGLGEKGTGELKNFASKGGTVVFLNDSSEWAIHHLGLTSIKNVLNGVNNREFYCPGSLLNVTRLDTHPLLLGMPKDFTVWFESGPAFEITPGGRDVAVASYSDGKVLASGWLLGEKYLQKKAAVVDSPMGSGHVILFGIRPQYRAQSYLTMKLLFNAMLYFE
ncbi:MAG: hypothetical protein SGI92_22970, partial [Bryobacteraceae bacterium]|nr:hypothetical protein [Bryobacteraceae bacterium]